MPLVAELKMGQSINDWKVDGFQIKREGCGRTYFVPCICKCGDRSLVRKVMLLNGSSPRCQKCAARLRFPPDEVDTRYGRCVVVDQSTFNEKNQRMSLCRCDCGKQFMTPVALLRNGGVTSCGCYRRALSSSKVVDFANKNKISVNEAHEYLESQALANDSSLAEDDLIGKQIGRLKVLTRAGRDKNGKALYLCQCSCDGRELIRSGAHLRKGGNQSCGCLRKWA